MITFLALLPLLCGGAIEPTGLDFELESLESPSKTGSAFPNLAQGADGKVYLSWVERGEKQLAVMWLSVLKDKGWSEPVEVMRGTDLFLNWADFPSVCVLENGVLIAQWLRQGDDPHGYMAEFSISSDGGKHWSKPKLLHDDRADVEHGFVSMIAIDKETFGAIWLDARKAAGKEDSEYQTALYFRTIGAQGELGKEMILDPRVCDCCPTSLVANAKGELLATYRDRSEEEVRDIALVKFDGKAWSEPRLVNDDKWLIDGCPVNGPRARTAAGLSAVAWFTGVGGGGGSVRLAFSKDDWFGAPIDIDEGRPVGRVDLVLLEKETALVAWMEYSGEGQADWRVRTVSQTGKSGASLKVGTVPSDRASGYLRMVPADDSVVLTWTTPEGDGQIETARLRRK